MLSPSSTADRGRDDQTARRSFTAAGRKAVGHGWSEMRPVSVLMTEEMDAGMPVPHIRIVEPGRTERHPERAFVGQGGDRPSGRHTGQASHIPRSAKAGAKSLLRMTGATWPGDNAISDTCSAVQRVGAISAQSGTSETGGTVVGRVKDRSHQLSGGRHTLRAAKAFNSAILLSKRQHFNGARVRPAL